MKKVCKECGEIKEMFSWEDHCYSCRKKIAENAHNKLFESCVNVMGGFRIEEVEK